MSPTSYQTAPPRGVPDSIAGGAAGSIRAAMPETSYHVRFVPLWRRGTRVRRELAAEIDGVLARLSSLEAAVTDIAQQLREHPPAHAAPASHADVLEVRLHSAR